MDRRSLIGAGVLLTLVGCTSRPNADPSATPATGTEPSSGKSLFVGLITNGPLTDSGWNSLAGEGLKQIQDELRARGSHQSAGPEEGEEALRGFARDGANLIFAHGAEYGDAAEKVAADYPDTVFVVSSGEVEGKNLASLRFYLGEAAYLAGMVAASLSKSGKAGQIGGQSFPAVKEGFELFEKGGKAINPAFTTTITYLNSWSDAGAAKEQALAMMRNGADILFQNCDAAAEGMFDAAGSSEGRRVLVVGSNANQNDLHPELIPCSAVLDVAKMFRTVADEVSGGTFQGKVYREDLASGNVYLAINPRFESEIPESVREEIRKAEEAIKSGALDLGGSA